MKRSSGVDVDAQIKRYSLLAQAQSYIKVVNERLGWQSDECTKFNSLLRDFRFRRIDAASLGVKITKLLDGHDDLILRFRSFMPDVRYDEEEEDDVDEDSEETTQTYPPVRFLKVIEFLNKVNIRFRNDKDVYGAFLQIMNQILDGCSLHERYDEIAPLLADQRDLLEEFDSILSDSSAHGGVDTGWRKRLCMQGIDVCEKVNSVLGSSDHQELLKLLHGYSTGEHDRDGLKARVSDLLKDKRNGLCLQEFNDFFKSCESSIKEYAVASLTNNPSTKEQEREHKHMTIAVPTHELDLSKCQKVSPSYWVLPENHSRPLASRRSKIGDQVLNENLVCISARGGDFPCKRRFRTQLEKYKDDCDDERCDMDTLRGNIISASKRIEKLLKKINNNKINLNLIKIEDHLSAINLRCIERVYGEQGLEIMELLHAYPGFALPVMLRRLTQKKQELEEFLLHFNEECARVYAKMQLGFKDKQHESNKDKEDEQLVVPSIEEDS